MTEMTYETLERSDVEYKADTFGLWPGVAGVYMENMADVFCPTCGEDMLGSELFERLKDDDLGYDLPEDLEVFDEFGNVAAVLSSEEWDCPGAFCGHCGIELDVTTIHYDGVCRPDTCDQIEA